MTQTTPLRTLDDALQLVLPPLLETLTEGELPVAVLQMLTADARSMMVAMDPRMDAFEMTLAARQMIFETEPAFATFAVEGWCIDPEADLDDPQVRQAILGEIELSSLPEAKRWEVLTVYVEAASGEHRSLIYRISHPFPGARRQLELSELGQDEAHTRLYPLFVVDATLRDVDGQADSFGPRPPALQKADDVAMHLLHLAARGIPPEEKRKQVRKAVAQMLERGAGGTTAGYEYLREQKAAALRQEILTTPARRPEA